MRTPEYPLRALVVDDEFRSRSSLKILLEKHFPSVQVVAEADTVASAISLCRETSPEVVFLDIELPDGSAFDFLEVMGPDSPKVIIISAHQEHSLKAYKYEAAHYLLKPIEVADLREAVHRVSHSAQPSKAKLPQAPDRLALPTLDGFRMVLIKDIVYLEADSNYTRFHFADKTSSLVSNTLGHYEELLADTPFYRIHNKFMINLMHIISYQRGRGGVVEMQGGRQLEVSVRKKDGFMSKLTEFAKGV